MASVSTEFKRLFLREVKWAAEAAEAPNNTLLAQLKAAARSGFASAKSGRAVTATSANGHSVQFASPNVQALAGQVTPQDAAELTEEMLTLYETVEAQGFSTEATIYAEMLALLQPIVEVEMDLSGYRMFA